MRTAIVFVIVSVLASRAHASQTIDLGNTYDTQGNLNMAVKYDQEAMITDIDFVT